jgi:hypothetical protein
MRCYLLYLRHIQGLFVQVKGLMVCGEVNRTRLPHQSRHRVDQTGVIGCDIEMLISTPNSVYPSVA